MEGVLVSDPKHSVLARIQLVPAAPVAGSSSATRVLAGTMQTSTAPEDGSGNAGLSAQSPPLQNTVSAPPVRTDIATKPGAVVSYRDGQLTIDAESATLAAVLQLVAERTGAVISVPSGSGLERIVEHAGPGSAKDVLTQLLNGTHFNFIIISSAQHPDEPEQVLLSMRGEDTQVAKTVSAPPAAPASSLLWTPPVDAAPVPLAPRFDSILTPPKEQLSPEAVGELMKEKARELREKIQQQAPPQ